MKATLYQCSAELALLLREKSLVAYSIFMPILMVLLMGYLNRGAHVSQYPYGNFLIAGGVGMAVSSAAFENVGISLAQQRQRRILKRLGGTPLRPWAFIAAKILIAVFLISIQAAIMIAISVLWFGAHLDGKFLQISLTLMMGAFTFSAMGMSVAGLARDMDHAAAVSRAISLPMQFLCGTFLPLQAMPPGLQHLARALPLTYFVDALRGATTNQGNAIPITTDWIVLLVCLSVTSWIAVRTFRWE